mmetsp:Transcript_39481/g.37933  ORF Transcript_39481/g.37933 Transcript_39481/m.37933 type:complete len:104 (+) Transcript_39481:574-885(+)
MLQPLLVVQLLLIFILIGVLGVLGVLVRVLLAFLFLIELLHLVLQLIFFGPNDGSGLVLLQIKLGVELVIDSFLPLFELLLLLLHVKSVSLLPFLRSQLLLLL